MPDSVTIDATGPWPFQNPKTGKAYSVVRADQVENTDKDHQRLVKLCNEPAVYDFLFRGMLQGQPYGMNMAEGFLRHAAEGWQRQSSYVFVMLDANSEICGAMDIKSNARKRAEIGYWASAEHSGIASPAVKVMCTIAGEAGFESLFAFVKTTNPKSVAVLERNEFLKSAGEDHTKDYPRFLFTRMMLPTSGRQPLRG